MKHRDKGFSLVEVVLAMGLAASVLLIVMALLPLGIKSNQISIEETRAGEILTALEADLRNSHPLSNSGKSLLFGLAMPYVADSSGRVSLNSSLSTYTVSSSNSTGILDDGTTASYESLSPRPRFQASVIYLTLPAAGYPSSIQARLVVNWPAQNTSNPAQLTSPGNVTGYVESYITFVAP